MPDTTLSTLFPAVPIRIGGERVSLRPVVLGELPEVDRVVEAWRLLIATGGDVLDSEAWEDFLGLLCAAVDRPRAWLDALSESEFERLATTALAINEEIWKPSPSPGTGNVSMKWSEIFQRLISHGHPASVIKGYTLAQANAYLGECLKADREELAMNIQAAAFSMVDGKTVAGAVKELRRG
jgi:hypothetical protein